MYRISSIGGLLYSELDDNMENNCSKEVNITVNAVFWSGINRVQSVHNLKVIVWWLQINSACSPRIKVILSKLNCPHLFLEGPAKLAFLLPTVMFCQLWKQKPWYDPAEVQSLFMVTL